MDKTRWEAIQSEGPWKDKADSGLRINDYNLLATHNYECHCTGLKIWKTVLKLRQSCNGFALPWVFRMSIKALMNPQNTLISDTNLLF